MGNVADLLRSTARAAGDRPGLISGSTITTWSHLDTAVDELAAGLIASGLRSGDRVALLLGNSSEFVTSYFAVLRAGLVAVPLNTGYTAPECASLLLDSGASMIIVSKELSDVALEAISHHSVAVTVVVAGSREWRALFDLGRKTALAEPGTPDDALALLLFTAGTSGRPKGAMLTHGNLLANIDQLLALDNPAAVRSDDVALIVLPLFHVYGLNAAFTVAVAVGATCVLLDRFDPRETLEIITTNQVTNIAGAPPMYVVWSKVPGVREAMAGVRLFSSGGAALDPEVFEAFREATGKLIWEGYGMTEASPVIATTLASGAPKPRSIGRPLGGVEVRLVDDGDDVDEGDPGELWVRGANVFGGYWPDGLGGPDSHGWFNTGDVAYFDDEGDLHLVDRRRELILVSGFNVYPREIELAISAMDGVAECAVVGVDDAYTGEAVKALVVPVDGVTLTPEAVISHCETRLARFKCPTVVQIVPGLPHSATGKIAKGRLREVHGE